MKTRVKNKSLYIVIAAIIASALLCFLAVGLTRAARGQNAAEESSGTAMTSAASDTSDTAYEAKNFTAVPSDFEQISGSDAAHTATAFFDGEMSIDHSGTTGNAPNYYGAAYKIAKDKEYGDFVFEMSFRAVSYVNESRFIAVMFHTKQSGSRQIGYMVNYRMNGGNAVSALSSSAAHDEQQKSNGTPLTDKKLHVLRLELNGYNGKYYMDDVLLWDYDFSQKNGNLGGAIEKGGFNLIVDKCRIMIKSIKISETDPGETGQPQKPIKDDIIASTYYQGTGQTAAPTVVCDVTDETVLSRVVGDTAAPASVILNYGADGNVKGSDGETLGAFEDVYTSIRGRMVPIVRVESAAAADKFIEYMTKERSILDISVASSDPALVKKVRLAIPTVRGVIFYDEVTDASEIVKELNINRAVAAVIPQRCADVDTVTKIQARFKTVWVTPDSYMAADIGDCINSGAGGIVSAYYRDVYDVLATYDEHTVFRTAMNVAHRGCSNLTYENSLSAVRLAVQNGATHLELDGKLTTDGRIVIMHDDELAATTTGTGNIESKSYAQLMDYDLTLRDAGGAKDVYMTDAGGNKIIEKIPTLEEVLDEIENTDVVLVFEIKTEKTAIVDKLKEVLEARDMKDRVVAITFNSEFMLDKMYDTLPEVPVAWLEGLGGTPLSVNEFGTVLRTLGEGNAALDKSWSHGGASLALDRYLRDRGILGWYWTFTNEAAVSVGESMGYLGITNNCAEMYKTRVRKVSGAEQSKAALAVGDTVKVTVTDYSGDAEIKDAAVSYCRKTVGGWRVIAAYNTDRGIMYTQSFTVNKA